MHSKAKVAIEAVVLFGVTLFLIAVLSGSPLGEWQRRHTPHPFLEYALMIALPLLLIAVRRGRPADYGLTLKGLKQQLDIFLTALVPFAVASLAFAFLNHKRWDHAFLLAGIRIALLFVLALMMKKKPAVFAGAMLPGFVLVMLAGNPASQGVVESVMISAVFFIIFLGPGEELLFRGYIQSRLNSAWGRPFRFFGAPWGWGVIMTSALFGLMHVLSLGDLTGGDWRLSWSWGFWTFFSGLVYSYVREKSGGILAPALLHGLPQAIAHIILLSAP